MKYIKKHSGQAHRLRSGQAALSLVFLIGGIIIFIGATLAFVVISFINSSFGFQAANRAEALAMGGIEDGFLQLARKNNFSDATGYCIPNDSLSPPCGSGSVWITVVQNIPASGEATITATSTVSLYTRELQSVVTVNGTTGEVSVISLNSVVL